MQYHAAARKALAAETALIEAFRLGLGRRLRVAVTEDRPRPSFVMLL